MSCRLISTAFTTSPLSRKLLAVFMETKATFSSRGVPVKKMPVTVRSVDLAVGNVAEILSPSLISRFSAKVRPTTAFLVC
jgi:hypothetical protein